MPRKLSVRVEVHVGGARYSTLRYRPEAVTGVELAEICQTVKQAALFAERVNKGGA